jgi:hypothetical protein
MSLLSVAENINHRHCEERSNRELYRASMQAPLLFRGLLRTSQ